MKLFYSLLFRSLLFSYLENLTIQLSKTSEEATVSAAKQEYERVLRIVKNSKDDLVAVGYDEFAVESFYEVIIPIFCPSFTYILSNIISMYICQTFLEFLEEVPAMTPDTLFRRFVESGEADYYTWYMRLLTAGRCGIVLGV